MPLKPYNTTTKLINKARSQGHIVLPNQGSVKIDTGETVLHIKKDEIKNTAGESIKIDAAMDIIEKSLTD
jgi:hypothetical protein